MSLTDMIVGALIGGCAVIVGGVVVAKYKWRRHIDFVCIKEIYAPLHAKIIEIRNSLTKFVGISPGDVETFVRRIKDNYWYSRVSKEVSEKFQEWQSRVFEYGAIVRDVNDKICQAVNQEVEKRAAALESHSEKNRLVSNFKDILKEGFSPYISNAPSWLIKGKVNDEEYYFISNFKRGGAPPEREIKDKLAGGFPRAIYEVIRKGPALANLHDKVKEVEDATARLRDVLEKRIKK